MALGLINFAAMFTDDQTTPVRLEILLDLLRKFPRGLSREGISRLLQPEPLAGEKTNAARATVKAALELEIVQEQGDTLKLVDKAKMKADTRTTILSAFDQRVLTNWDTEPYFALFYAYYLGLGKAAQADRRDRNAWVTEFNKVVFGGVVQSNPFNETKLTGLHRWFNYVGLGWYDPAEVFQPNPYDRLRRTLLPIFSKSKKLSCDEWMERLAEHCPELDGGHIFRRANPNLSDTRKCSLGLSHALVELDLDGVIRLDRPADSAGWSIEDAEPPIESSADKQGTRISFVELIAKP